MTISHLCESLLPAITPATEPFWDACNVGELRLQRCVRDGAFRYPESPVCPHCLSAEYSWEPVSGGAKLWSWITMHQNYFPALVDCGPYVVAFVELDEGPFLISAIASGSGPLECGQRLELGFEAVAPGRNLPIFKVVAT